MAVSPTFGDKASGKKVKVDPLTRVTPRFPPLYGPLVCRLCKSAGPHVRTSVRNVKDTDLGPGGFRAFPACQDRLACRERREDQGKSWPLIDGTRPLMITKEEAFDGTD